MYYKHVHGESTTLVIAVMGQERVLLECESPLMKTTMLMMIVCILSYSGTQIAYFFGVGKASPHPASFSPSIFSKEYIRVLQMRVYNISFFIFGQPGENCWNNLCNAMVHYYCDRLTSSQ